MAILANKINIKQNNKTYQCECYTVQSEAIPTGGSYLNVKNNGVNCFVGLQIAGKTQYDTPVQVKKNNIVYNIQTKVANNRHVVIQQTAHQTIKVNCNNTIYTANFDAPVGAIFSVTVEAETGWLAGAPNIANGNIPSGEGDYIISASPASKAQYQVTINQVPNQTIMVTTPEINVEKRYTSSFQAEYNTLIGIENIVPENGYIAGNRIVTGDYIDDADYFGMYRLRGNITISAEPATIKKYTVSVTQPQNGNITVNGQIGTSFSINHGASTTIQANANEGYKVDALYVDTQI